MSRYRPDPNPPTDPVGLAEYLQRQLWRISTAIEQQFDNEPVWDDLRIPAVAGKPATGQAPDFTVVAGTIEAFGFDGIATAEYLNFAVQLPHGYKEGSTIKPHVHWTTRSATSNAAVVWTLEYVMANVNGTLATTTTTLTATGSCSATGTHRLTAFGDISAPATTISAMILGRIGRNPAVAGDTYAHDAYLLELDFHVQLDSAGSVKLYIKT